MELCDVLLYEPNSNDKVGSIISMFTFGKYCHAAIYIGDSIVEAMPPAIRKTKDLRIFDLFRYQELSYQEKIIMINFLKSKIGTPYATQDFPATFIRQFFNRNDKPIFNSENQYYCSELIAAAFSLVGIEICNSIHWQNVTPNDLGYRSKLKKVLS